MNRKMIVDRPDLHRMLSRLLAHLRAVAETLVLPPVPRAVLVLNGRPPSSRRAPTD